MGEMIKAGILGLAVAIIASIVITGVIGTGGSSTNTPTANVAKNYASGEYQEVKLTFKNYRYELEPSTLTKDLPVRMEVDLDTVYGCMRDIVISQFGVRKYVREGDNIIEFTPDKAGTFNIACSMNMGRGTFNVVESDGSESNFVEAPIQGSSCGAEGGCGCGGY